MTQLIETEGRIALCLLRDKDELARGVIPIGYADRHTYGYETYGNDILKLHGVDIYTASFDLYKGSKEAEVFGEGNIRLHFNNNALYIHTAPTFDSPMCGPPGILHKKCQLSDVGRTENGYEALWFSRIEIVFRSRRILPEQDAFFLVPRPFKGQPLEHPPLPRRAIRSDRITRVVAPPDDIGDDVLPQPIRRKVGHDED